MFLRRFDAADAHDGGGYATSAAWLATLTRIPGRPPRAAVRQMRATLENLKVLAACAPEKWRSQQARSRR